MKRRNQDPQHRVDQKSRTRRSQTGGQLPPQTAEDFFAMSEDSQDEWNRIIQALSKMKTDKKVSLARAELEFGLPQGTVLRLAGSALRKAPNGRYVAKENDQLLRVIVFLTSEGLREIAVRDSRQASLAGEHWAAVQRYYETGNADRLHRFAGKHIILASGERLPFLTDLDELDRLGSAGVVSFESLYARSS